MHWATPKTERMIDQRHADTPPKPAPPEEEDDDGGDDGVTYEPTPYETLGQALFLCAPFFVHRFTFSQVFQAHSQALTNSIRRQEY